MYTRITTYSYDPAKEPEVLRLGDRAIAAGLTATARLPQLHSRC